MTKKTSIFVVIFLVLLFGISIFGYTVFRGRNIYPADTGTTKSEQQNQDEKSSQTDLPQNDTVKNSTEKPGEDSTSNDESDEDDIIPQNEDAKTFIEDNNYLNISKNDCDNKCKNYKKAKDFRYCKEVCGISSSNKKIENENDCNALNGLEKDYCIRDLAFNKKDLGKCSQISDTSIRKTCRDKIGQELINIRE